MPWLLILLAVNKRAAAAATGRTQPETSALSLVKNWAANIGRVFLDVGLNSESASIYLILFGAANLCWLAIAGYAVYSLCSETGNKFGCLS
jgi:hypothetical protein